MARTHRVGRGLRNRRSGRVPLEQTAANLLDVAVRAHHVADYAEAADAYDVAADALEELGDLDNASYARRQSTGLRRHGPLWKTVKVVFRRWPIGQRARHGLQGVEGRVIALMPEVPSDVSDAFVQSYMHGEGHAAAYYAAVISDTKPATPAQYADLSEEMTQLGYDVVPIARWRRP